MPQFKVGDRITVTVNRAPQRAPQAAPVDDVHYGPIRRIEDPSNPAIPTTPLWITDISSIAVLNNRTNNGSVVTVEVGRAVIGGAMGQFGFRISEAGDTYGESQTTLSAPNVVISNESVLVDLLQGGG